MQRGPLALLLAIALGIVTFYFWFTSPTQVLQRRIHSLFESATFSSPLNPVTRRLRTLGLENRIADSLTLNLPSAGLNSTLQRDELLAGFEFFLQETRSCQFKNLTIISVDADGPDATARVSFVSQMLSPPRTFPNGPHTATLSFNHASGDWRATAISVDP